MKNRAKVILSFTLLLAVLFVASFSVFSAHEHSCEQTECFICELIRNINDGIFSLLIFIIAYAIIIGFDILRLDYIIIEYKSRVLSLTKLGIKLRNWFSVFVNKANTEKTYVLFWKYERNELW